MLTVAGTVTDSAGTTTPWSASASILGGSVEDDRWAIRVFPTFKGRTYENHAVVLDYLQQLGIRRISHKLFPGFPAKSVTFTQNAAAMGILSWFTLGEPRTLLTPVEWEETRWLLTGPFRGIVTKVSPFNEPQYIRGSGEVPVDDWLPVTIQAHADLRANIDLVNADLARDGIPPIKVASSPLWNGNAAIHDAALELLAPAVRDYVDEACWHLYKTHRIPMSIDNFVTQYEAAYPGKPLWSHETGVSTAPNQTSGAISVTEAEQVDHLLAAVNAYDERGLGLSWFELLDDPDPAGTDREDWLGLIRTPTSDPATWYPKPAFLAFRDWLAAQYAVGG